MGSLLINKRPGSLDIKPASQTKPFRINDFIYLSEGASNSYLIETPEGNILINTGLGVEAPVHKYCFDQVNKHEITSTFSKFNETNRYLNLKAILFSSKLENMTKSEEKIETLSLDDIFKKKNIQNIDLIKIDTEGHEYEVLIGARDSIKKIDCILVEFHNDNIYENYNSEKIHNFLIENNFTLLKRFNFPFTTWEDRLYKNSKL